jgi:hypothetical protein
MQHAASLPVFTHQADLNLHVKFKKMRMLENLLELLVGILLTAMVMAMDDEQ